MSEGGSDSALAPSLPGQGGREGWFILVITGTQVGGEEEAVDKRTHHGREVACKKGVGPSGRSRHSSSKSRSYRPPPRSWLHCVARPVAAPPRVLLAYHGIR